MAQKVGAKDAKISVKVINIKESLRFSQRAHYRMDARSKYKTSRVIWRSLSCGLTRRGVVVAEKGSSGRSRWHGGKSEDSRRSCTKWRKARSEKRNVEMSCDAFVERAIYLPHRPPTDNFLKPLACTKYSDYLLRQQVFAVAILEYYTSHVY